MATFSKQFLSASTDGLGIAIVATGSVGTTLHTAHSTSIDEIMLYATNTNTGALNLTIEWGTTGATNSITQSIPANAGLTLLTPGLILTNSKVVTAYAASANKILIFGYVNRIT